MAPCGQGCQIFLGTKYQNGEKYPNDHKICQMAIKYFQWPKNRPNGHKIYQDLSLQDSAKFTQIGNFGLKTNHLATLLVGTFSDKNFAPGERASGRGHLGSDTWS
jgi:hypothetical protein